VDRAVIYRVHSLCLCHVYVHTLVCMSIPFYIIIIIIRVYPKVSGLAAWSENCKWYSSLPLGAVVLLFCESA
jgi:hypothetical protein